MMPSLNIPRPALIWIYLSAAALVVAAAIYLFSRPAVLPLSKIEVQGELTHLTKKDIHASAAHAITGNFFTVDLNKIQVRLRGLPWVRRVEIQRVWPSTLVIKIEEQQALARWDTNGLINNYGERFLANLDELDDELPIFMGPPQYAASIAQHYQLFKRLLESLDLTPMHVLLTPRYGWRVRLDNGLILELGRTGMEARLKKFVQASLDSGIPVESMAYADLRYANGFAVRFTKG